MALSDKNILITPNVGQTANPKIVFSGADASTSAQNITLQVYPINSGTLSFEGSTGQLFSINNTLTGTLFAVNDISGIPSIEVLDTGLVKLAQYNGRTLIGTGTDNGTSRLQVGGNVTSTSTTTGTVIVTGGVGISENLNVGGNTIITGNLTVNGTTTTINSATYTVDDPNIVLGDVTSPTDTTANGGGLTLKGATDKTIVWDSANTNWTSSEHWNLATGKVYKINNVQVLSATALGSGVTSSSLTSVGTIGTGTWQGSVIGPTYGGTGVNNGTNTLTINTGNLTFTAQSGGSSVTVPSTGTLATTGNLSQFAATTSAQLAGVISDETGTGALVFATSPTLVTPTVAIINGATTASGTLTLRSTSNGTKATAGILMDENIASTSYTTGALVITGGVGIGGDLFTNGNVKLGGTGFLQVPSGTAAQQPGQAGQPTAAAGQIRYNTTTGQYEGYYSSGSWGSLAGASGNVTTAQAEEIAFTAALIFG